MTAPAADQSQHVSPTEWTAEEYRLWCALKPLLGECLSLNHALNNSLAGVLGYTEFLLSEPDSLTESQRHYLEQIVSCAELIRKRIEAVSLEKTALREKLDVKAISDALAPAGGAPSK